MEVNLSIVALVKIALTSTLLSTITTWLLSQYRTSQARGRSGTFSALLLATTLEQFVYACTSTLSGHYYGDATPDPHAKAGAILPVFPPYSDAVDWRALPLALCERALIFPREVNVESKDSINFLWDHAVIPNDYDEALAETARCGLSALDLAAALRSFHGLPNFHGQGYSRAFLSEQLEETEQRIIDEGKNGLEI